jgi:class 3 adenylate cyclase
MRTTVIAKTDIVGYTPRVFGLSEKELQTLLANHKRFVGDVIAKYGGEIFKEQGDAFLIIFPSVTTAVLASLEIHRNLMVMQAGRGEDQRMAVRVVITAGDLLHQEGDIFGTAINIISRIESITPADEIYLSHAAWLLLNKAEVPTSFVNSFNLKGIETPEKIYKVEQKHQTKTIEDKVIVYTDARGTVTFMENNDIETVEAFLMGYDDLLRDICASFEGVIRNASGDSYILTFESLPNALKAVEHLRREWRRISPRFSLGLVVSIHIGVIHIFRSYIYGADINTVVILSRLSRIFPGIQKPIILVSQRIKDGIEKVSYGARLMALDMEKLSQLSTQSAKFAQEHGAYQLLEEA